MINFEQLVLAARRSDSNDAWQEIFVFILMAIIWLIAGISKMKAKNAADQRKMQENLRPPDQSRQSRPTAQVLHAPQSKFRHEYPENRFMSRVENYLRKEQQKSQPSAKHVLKAETEESVATMEPTIENVPAAIPTYDIIKGLSNSDSLRNAIIYHEILSKPKALQESNFLE